MLRQLVADLPLTRNVPLLRRHHGACHRGPVTGSKIHVMRSCCRHGACPRGAAIVSRAVNRGSTGTSPVAAVLMLDSFLANNHSSTGTSPVESLLQNSARRF